MSASRCARPAFGFVVAVFLLAGFSCAKPHPSDTASGRTAKIPGGVNVLYFDMDGTILTSEKKVLPETVEAMRAFRACGGHIGIASGRTPEQVAVFLSELPLDLPAVLFNGGLTLAPPKDAGGQWSVESMISLSRGAGLEAAKVLSGSLPLPLPPLLAQYGTGTSLASGDLGDFLHYAGIPGERVEPCELQNCLVARLEKDEALPLKIMLIAGNERDAVTLDRFLDTELQLSRSVVSDPKRGVVEILPSDVNKAVAIRKVIAARGLDPQRVGIFGDSENDVEMLRGFGVGFAMASGMPAAKAAADEVIGGVDPPANDTPVIAETVRSLLRHGCPRE